MKRIVMISLVCAALVGFVALPALFAADAPKGDIVMKWGGDKVTQGPATMSHAKHAKVKCEDCHHKMKENPKDMKCTGCHGDFAAKQGEKSAYNAYHAAASKHSCLGCHKAMKSGPTVCNKCHAKK